MNATKSCFRRAIALEVAAGLARRLPPYAQAGGRRLVTACARPPSAAQVRRLERTHAAEVRTHEKAMTECFASAAAERAAAATREAALRSECDALRGALAAAAAMREAR